MKSEACAQGRDLDCLGRIKPNDYPPNCTCSCHGPKGANTPSHGKVLGPDRGRRK